MTVATTHRCRSCQEDRPIGDFFNIGIGALGDDASGVRRALTYLDKPDTAGLSAGLLF